MSRQRYMTEAPRRYPTEPVYPGQLVGKAGRLTITDNCGDGSAIIRCFDDEDLAMQCSLKTGLPIDAE